MDVAVWGFIGVIVGGAITLGGELLRGRQAADLDRRKRDDDRRMELDRIQRDTLLELQPALTEWLRAMMQLRLADEDSFREAGTPGPFDEVRNTREMLAGRKLTYLTERVRDAALRERLTRLRSLEIPGTLARTPEDAERAGHALIVEGAAAQEHIGRVLRTYL